MSNAWTPTAPEGGERITIENETLRVPDNPVVPFIEGDGTGVDIWAASPPGAGRGGGEGVRR
jgi:isocitrate dehydrogenase